jgi:hypothetical protein
VLCAEQEVLGDQEQRQDDQEEVVVAEGVVAMVADQRPQQHGDDGGEEEVAGQAEDQWWQFAGKPHAGAFEQPGRDEDDQRRAVVAADLHPVLGRGEQEAAEDGPAEAEEHLVRVPLAGRERCRWRRQRAREDQRPEHRQAESRQAGEGKEGSEADQPQRVGRKAHAGSVLWVARERLVMGGGQYSGAAVACRQASLERRRRAEAHRSRAGRVDESQMIGVQQQALGLVCQRSAAVE